MLAVISLSNVATPAAYAAQRLVVDFPAAQQSKGLSFAARPTFEVDQGSVLGASTSLLTVGTQELDLIEGNGGSAYKRIAPRVEPLAKRVYRIDEDVQLAVVNPDNEAFTTTVMDNSGNQVSVPLIEQNTGNTTTVDLAPSDQIKPGKYEVTITDAENKSTQQDFTWGVLAMNFDKSEYHPGETGDIAFGVLNDRGDMVCNADLELSIKNAALGINDTLSTRGIGNTAIIVNSQCQKHDFSLEPDYEGHYKFGAAGNYQLQLTAKTQNGIHTITDSIQVTDKIPFDVQRVSATRIYPPNTYPVTFNITAHRDFSGTVTETVPDSFTITPATGSAQTTSYDNMQTVYLNSNDPAALMSQAIAASTSGGLVMPFHGNYPITQGFGAQLTDPTLQAFYTQYGLAGHDGIDFGVPMNTPLYAVDGGTIIWSGPGDYGTMVTIQHSWGETYYGHMSNTSVIVGEHVDKGQIIGYSGMSGEATGPHLHFGMKPNNPDISNGYYGKIDPMPFLPIGQGEPIAALGGSANPIANAVYNQTVLGSSDSATTPTPSDMPTATPTATPTPSNGADSSITTPTPTPTTSSGASPVISQAANQETVTPTVSPVPSVFSAPAPAADTNFTVLDKQILLDEQIANNSLTEKVKIITWHVSLKKGESTSLGYAFQAPHVSPQFYLLGPAHFYDAHGKDVFQEQRQWQIASDDVGVEWFQETTGSPFNGYSWQYRKKIIIDHTKVSGGSDLTNFPVAISISGDADLTAHAQATAADIVFTDSTGKTLLPFEIENPSNTALVAWVNISTLSASVDTIIYMYYGNPSATSKANVHGTWNNNYVAVYHLGENAANTTITDSTSDGYTGTAHQNTSATFTSSGQIDGAQTYNGTSDGVNIGDHPNLDFGLNPFTVSIWVKKSTDTNAPDVPLIKGAATIGQPGYDFELTSGNWNGHVCDGGTYDCVTNKAVFTSNENGTWQNLVMVVDKGANLLRPYQNGSALTTKTIVGLTSVSGTRKLAIGWDQDDNGFWFTGSIDEVEISSGMQTAGWIGTEYNNQHSPGPGGGGFVSSLGSVETDIYAPTMDKVLGHGEWFDSTGTRQPFVF